MSVCIILILTMWLIKTCSIVGHKYIFNPKASIKDIQTSALIGPWKYNFLPALLGNYDRPTEWPTFKMSVQQISEWQCGWKKPVQYWVIYILFTNQDLKDTGCSLNNVFSLNFFEFSELCQFCCSAGVLPAWRVYTHWHREKTESG